MTTAQRPRTRIICWAPDCGDDICVHDEVVMVDGMPWHACCAEYFGREGERGHVDHDGRVISERGEWLW